MKSNSAFDVWKQHASMTASMIGLVRTDAFQQSMKRQELIAFRPTLDTVREQQEQFNKAFRPALSAIREHQEMMQNFMTPGVVQATRAHTALMESLRPAVNAMAILRPPLIETAASFAVHQKTFAQMARLSRITALEETLQNIDHLFPAVHADMPQADAALPAFEYMEENQPELCQQVDETLVTCTDIDNKPADIDDYLLLCEQTMAGISGLIAVAPNPEIKCGLICLLTIFGQLFIYLKYSKTQQEKEKP